LSRLIRHGVEIDGPGAFFKIHSGNTAEANAIDEVRIRHLLGSSRELLHEQERDERESGEEEHGREGDAVSEGPFGSRSSLGEAAKEGQKRLHPGGLLVLVSIGVGVGGGGGVIGIESGRDVAGGQSGNAAGGRERDSPAVGIKKSTRRRGGGGGG
jgi:hypothetical protein